MSRYKLTHHNIVIRNDGVVIPTFDHPQFPNLNLDFLEYKSWLELGNIPDPADPIDIEIIRLNLFKALDEQYEEKMKILSSKYPQSERESWPVQIQEARALLANPLTAVPWITAAATQRGMTTLELATRIVAKDDAYRAIHGTLTGIKQRIEDAITVCKTHVQLQAIDIKAGWPI